MSAMGGMYTFLTAIQVITMTLQPILYIVGIVALIFAMRALFVYTKNNKKPTVMESDSYNQLQGSVFGSNAAEAEESAPAEEGKKEEESKQETVGEPKESAGEKME